MDLLVTARLELEAAKPEICGSFIVHKILIHPEMPPVLCTKDMTMGGEQEGSLWWCCDVFIPGAAEHGSSPRQHSLSASCFT